MLTPQEIQDKKFEKAVFGGYDMGQVDQFLDDLLVDYTALYKENAALKAKMRVLVDKIEEYRSVDEEMRKALFTAQVTAKDIVAKAQSEADAILKNARSDVQRSVAELQIGVTAEENRLMSAKTACGEYAQKIRALLQKNIEVMETIMDRPAEEYMSTAVPVDQPLPQPDVPETTVAEPAPVTAGDSTQDQQGGTHFFEVSLGESVPAPQPEPDEDSDTAKIYGASPYTPKPRFNFSDLRFGRDYKDDEESDSK